MHFLRSAAWFCGLTAAAAAQQTPNLFHTLLGISPADSDRHIAEVYRQLFHGDPHREAVYYAAPNGEGYVADVANHDARTEGLSYGMMIAVQLDHRDEFDRIWRFARTHLYHRDGAYRGFYAWHAEFDGTPLDEGPAPDGEEWFATALLFAADRWQDAAYDADAQELLHAMIHQHERGAYDMFDAATHLVVFAPSADAARFTDPSYQLPEFYEIWSRRARDRADRAFYAEAVSAARRAWRREANPVTGLMPDYARFDGRPFGRFGGHDQFAYDAWRTLAYPSLDWAWWHADPWEKAQAERVLRFLATAAPDAERFAVDGRPTSHNFSPGLWAMAAAAGLAADPETARPFVRRLWVMPTPDGEYRYYNGMLLLLALLEVGGRFSAY